MRPAPRKEDKVAGSVFGSVSTGSDRNLPKKHEASLGPTEAVAPPTTQFLHPLLESNPPTELASALLRRPSSVSLEQVHSQPQAELAKDPQENPRHMWFPRARILRVSLSEPRDVLQSERTFLGFLRFALSLCFTAVTLILGYHMHTGGSPGDGKTRPDYSSSLFIRIVAVLLSFLAFSTLILAGVVYFQTVRRYSQSRVRTHGKHHAVMVACVTAVVLTLAGLNISLIVDRFLHKE